MGPRQALHQHPWGREPRQALGRHQGSGQVVLSPGKGQGGTGQSANRPCAGRPGRCSGDVWRPEATWPDAGVTQHLRGSSEARGTALTPQAGPGLSDGRLGCAAAGPPEGARPTKVRLSHRRRRDRTGGRCPGRSPCFLHPVWHWHPLQHLGPAGQPRAPALGEGEGMGVPQGSSPRGGAPGPGREGAVWGIPDPQDGGARSSCLDDAWTAAERPAPPAGWTAPHLQPPQPPAHPRPLTRGTRPRPCPAPRPASAPPPGLPSPRSWQLPKLCHFVSQPVDVGKFGMVPKGVGAPPRTRGGQRGRLPSAEGWAGAETLVSAEGSEGRPGLPRQKFLVQ